MQGRKECYHLSCVPQTLAFSVRLRVPDWQVDGGEDADALTTEVKSAIRASVNGWDDLSEGEQRDATLQLEGAVVAIQRAEKETRRDLQARGLPPPQVRDHAALLSSIGLDPSGRPIIPRSHFSIAQLAFHPSAPSSSSPPSLSYPPATSLTSSSASSAFPLASVLPSPSFPFAPSLPTSSSPSALSSSLPFPPSSFAPLGQRVGVNGAPLGLILAGVGHDSFRLLHAPASVSCSGRLCPARSIPTGSCVAQTTDWSASPLFLHVGCIEGERIAADPVTSEPRSFSGWEQLTEEERTTTRTQLQLRILEAAQRAERRTEVVEAEKARHELQQAEYERIKRPRPNEGDGEEEQQGPFHVFSTYHKHGEYSLATYHTELELRRACVEELERMGVEEEEDERDDRDEAERRRQAINLANTLFLYALIDHVIRRAEELSEEGVYNWVEVVQGGQVLKRAAQ